MPRGRRSYTSATEHAAVAVLAKSASARLVGRSGLSTRWSSAWSLRAVRPLWNASDAHALRNAHHRRAALTGAGIRPCGVRSRARGSFLEPGKYGVLVGRRERAAPRHGARGDGALHGSGRLLHVPARRPLRCVASRTGRRKDGLDVRAARPPVIRVGVRVGPRRGRGGARLKDGRAKTDAERSRSLAGAERHCAGEKGTGRSHDSGAEQAADQHLGQMPRRQVRVTARVPKCQRVPGRSVCATAVRVGTGANN